MLRYQYHKMDAFASAHFAVRYEQMWRLFMDDVFEDGEHMSRRRANMKGMQFERGCIHRYNPDWQMAVRDM